MQERTLEEGRPEPKTVIEVVDASLARDLLDPHVGLVVDLELDNRDPLSGVIVEVTATSLLIRGWDSRAHGPIGDLITLDIAAVRRVAIP
jgi:hypothetical protein